MGSKRCAAFKARGRYSPQAVPGLNAPGPTPFVGGGFSARIPGTKVQAASCYSHICMLGDHASLAWP